MARACAVAGATALVGRAGGASDVPERWLPPPSSLATALLDTRTRRSSIVSACEKCGLEYRGFAPEHGFR